MTSLVEHKSTTSLCSVLYVHSVFALTYLSSNCHLRPVRQRPPQGQRRWLDASRVSKASGCLVEGFADEMELQPWWREAFPKSILLRVPTAVARQQAQVLGYLPCSHPISHMSVCDRQAGLTPHSLGPCPCLMPFKSMSVHYMAHFFFPSAQHRQPQAREGRGCGLQIRTVQILPTDLTCPDLSCPVSLVPILRKAQNGKPACACASPAL